MDPIQNSIFNSWLAIFVGLYIGGVIVGFLYSYCVKKRNQQTSIRIGLGVGIIGAALALFLLAASLDQIQSTVIITNVNIPDFILNLPNNTVLTGNITTLSGKVEYQSHDLGIIFAVIGIGIAFLSLGISYIFSTDFDEKNGKASNLENQNKRNDELFKENEGLRIEYNALLKQNDELLRKQNENLKKQNENLRKINEELKKENENF